MEVILLTEITNLGGLGDIVKTRDGYARNYLIPYGHAKPATPENRAEVESHKEELQAKAREAYAEAEKIHRTLDGTALSVEVETKDGFELYGSIGVVDIVKYFNEAGHEDVHKNEIMVADAIRKVGEYEIGVRLHPELSAKVTLTVTSKGGDEGARAAREEGLSQDAAAVGDNDNEGSGETNEEK